MMRQACRQVGMVGSWSRSSQLFGTGHSLFLGKGGRLWREDPCDSTTTQSTTLDHLPDYNFPSR